MNGKTDGILALLPHRPPFLFVDEVLERGERAIKTLKTLRHEEPYLAGHYPGRPLMPGVLLCECVSQAGAALLSSRVRQHEGKIPVLAKIENARFRRAVLPGAVLLIEAEIVEEMRSLFRMRGSVSVKGENALRTEFVVAIVKLGSTFENFA